MIGSQSIKLISLFQNISLSDASLQSTRHTRDSVALNSGLICLFLHHSVLCRMFLQQIYRVEKSQFKYLPTTEPKITKNVGLHDNAQQIEHAGTMGNQMVASRGLLCLTG